MIFRHFFSGLVHFSILGIAGVSFLGKCRLPNKNDWRLEATGEKTNEPGKRKNQLLRRIDLYRDLEEKHTHIYAYNCIFTNASIYIYIYCIILYTHMRLWYYLAPAKHWHRKVFPRTFQRATRHANPTYTSQAIDLTQSSSLRKWRGWDGIPESPVSFSLILRECCQLF